MNNIITILNKIKKNKDKLTLKIFIKYISEKNLKKKYEKSIITALEKIAKMMNEYAWQSTHNICINNVTKNIIYKYNWEEYYCKTIYDIFLNEIIQFKTKYN